MNTDSSFFVSNNKNSKNIGRFAPSPSGPLHFGSLIAATASYLNVKIKQDGKWLLRIEDVDTQRIQKGATQSIINTLEAYGFEWDDEIIYQSQRSEIYKDTLDSIKEFIYPCSCTRKSLMASTGSYSYIYPGFCRNGMINPLTKNQSTRVITNQTPIGFTDQCQIEKLSQNINKEVGDFILKRSDGLWAYQLAVVVDDALQGVTEIVRGADLFDNTPRQIYLQEKLGYSTPQYLHFPVVVDSMGKKLSKQNGSPEVATNQKRSTLISTLEFLGQKPPSTDEFSSLNEVWAWAFSNWDTENIPKVMLQPFFSHKSSKKRGGDL